MAKTKDNSTIIIVVIILAVFVLFGGFGIIGFGGMMHGGYGSNVLCSTVGGIWCYWPNWMVVFMGTFMILIVVALVLFIVWFSKQMQSK